MTSAAQFAVNETVGHGIDLLRFEEGLGREILGRMEALRERLTTLIERIDPSAPARTAFQQKRLEALLKQTEVSIRSVYGEIRQLHQHEMAGLARLESGFAKTLLSNATVGVPAETVGLSRGIYASMARGELIDGAKSATWWSRQGRGLIDRFTDQMRQGIENGESTAGLVRRLRGTSTGRRVVRTINGKRRVFTVFKGGIMDVTTRQAEALSLTSTASIGNQARRATYQANAGLVQGLVQISTLDDNVTETCLAYADKAFDLDGNPIDHNLPYNGGTPRHWRCRSVEVPWIMAANKIHLPRGKTATAAAKQTLSGTKPANLNMSRYIEETPMAQLAAHIGRGKAQLLKRGTIGPTDLFNAARLRPATLAELLKLAGLAA